MDDLNTNITGLFAFGGFFPLEIETFSFFLKLFFCLRLRFDKSPMMQQQERKKNLEKVLPAKNKI